MVFRNCFRNVAVDFTIWPTCESFNSLLGIVDAGQFETNMLEKLFINEPKSKSINVF
jgi:hypothetical protein